jgi:hypothetical protein
MDLTLNWSVMGKQTILLWTILRLADDDLGFLKQIIPRVVQGLVDQRSNQLRIHP